MGGALLGATAAAALGTWAVAAIGGAVLGAIAGGLSAALAGGDLGDVLRGAAIGGISGALAAGLAASPFGGNPLAVAGQGVIGGAKNEAMGGKFQDGFLSAAAASAAQYLPGPNDGVGGLIKSSAVGGTASSLGGGKFANGAITAAFQYLVTNGLSGSLTPQDTESLNFDSAFRRQNVDFNINWDTNSPNYGRPDIECGWVSDGMNDASVDVFSLVPLGRAAGASYRWALEIPNASKVGLVEVTSWAEAGAKPVLESGRWVMQGGASKWNYVLSGVNGLRFSLKQGFYKLNVPIENRVTEFISQSHLVAPGLQRGVDAIKGLWPWGQRIIK
jgi:hypothetical protein